MFPLAIMNHATINYHKIWPSDFKSVMNPKVKESLLEMTEAQCFKQRFWYQNEILFMWQHFVLLFDNINFNLSEEQICQWQIYS